MNSEITTLLKKVGEGDRQVLGELAPLVLAELRQMAKACLGRGAGGQTWQPTDLVNELWARLLSREKLNFENRGHFFATAALVMRSLMVDHARQRLAHKRIPRSAQAGSAELDRLLHIPDEQCAELVALDEAMRRMAETRPRQSRIVELRYFAGLTVRETAEALGLSEKTIKREWAVARAWLHVQLRGSPVLPGRQAT